MDKQMQIELDSNIHVLLYRLNQKQLIFVGKSSKFNTITRFTEFKMTLHEIKLTKALIMLKLMFNNKHIDK